MENYQLGREVVEYNREHPEEFRMHTFGHRTKCGTVACLAGTALLLAGYELAGYEKFRRPDGTMVLGGIGLEAQRLLGMSIAEAECFYHQGTGPAEFLEMVRAAEEKAAAERGELWKE